jgi:hypothetical protein
MEVYKVCDWVNIVVVVVNDEVKIDVKNLLIRNPGVGFSGIAFVS